MKTSHAYTGRALLLGTALALALTGCAGKDAETRTPSTDGQTESVEQGADEQGADEGSSSDASAGTSLQMSSTGVIDTASLFTDRDLEQVADTSAATTLTVADGQDIQISEPGTYVITGSASELTISVEVDADAEEKVQLVLDGVSITNTDAPAIYVRSADKVFVTTSEGSENRLAVTGAFTADGDTNTDAVIFSKDDLVLNGLGSLTIESSDNGVSCKDDLKITGGSYTIVSAGDALEANDSIAVAGGSIAITSSDDGLQAENDEDDTQGFVYICGGSLSIDAAGDGIQAHTYLQIDGGTLSIGAEEGLEATYVQINGGTIDIDASDDGINATAESAICTPTIEISGGDVTIDMAAGDTDALDANGDIYISGGSVTINAQSAFDFEGVGELSGGSVTVNGEQLSAITNSMMGGMGAGPAGQMDGGFGGAPMGGPRG